MIDTISALFNLADGYEEQSQMIIDYGFVPLVVPFLGHVDLKVQVNIYIELKVLYIAAKVLNGSSPLIGP